MGVYSDRVRRIPITTRNALFATFHTEIDCPINGRVVCADNSRWRYDHSYSKYTEDHITPNWSDILTSGQPLNNPFYTNEVREDVTATTFSGSRPNDDLTNMFYLDICDDATAGVGYCLPPSGIDSVIGNAKVYVGTKCMGKAHSEQIQFLATIGEGKETLHMLRGICRTILNVRPALKKYGLSLLRAARAPKRLAKKLYLDAENAWMYVRMGLRPFSGECENLHAAITHQTEQRWMCRFASKKDLYFSNKTLGSQVTVNQIRCSHEKTYDEQTTVSAGVIMRAKVGGYPDTWGLTQIPQSIWEVTTLSWAVDYFLNIGDLIAACTPDTFWTPHVTWTTVHRSIEEIIRAKQVSCLGYGPTIPEGGYRRRTTKRILRTPGVLTGLVYKGMLNLNTQKEECLDILAVTRQKMTSTLNWLKPIKGSTLDWRPRK